jgi:hypothetical protein
MINDCDGGEVRLEVTLFTSYQVTALPSLGIL